MMGHHHDVDATPEAATLTELVPGVFAWVQPDGTWWINNAGAITDPSGREVFIVDTCATATRTRRFLDAVADATGDAPIRWAVNTHEHGDHTYGNWLLPGSATLFGHSEMRIGLAGDFVIDGCPPIWEPVPDWGAQRRRLPDVTITRDATVHVGARTIELRHPGHAAHTGGDLVAWLPDERVLFTGDLIFHGLTPLVMAGSLDGAREALEWIADFEPSVVVPGHGPIVTADELEGVLADHDGYYRLVGDLARRLIAEDAALLDVARDADLGRFAEWADAERLVLNLHRAVAETGGPPFDLLAAFGDAMAYNGGPLTTHVCCMR